MTTPHFLALDFGSGRITAVLTAYDEATGTCRVRHALRETCPAVSACYILDFDTARRALERVFEQMNEFVTFSPTVSVGLRGDFLSYRRSGGFQPVENKNRIITDKDIQAALDNSIPPTLDEDLEVVDLLPQSYTIDGKTGVLNPVGLAGCCLDVETFLSCGLATHLNNLNRVMAAAGCEDFEAVPAVLALCSSLLKPEEKQNGVLLLDIGAQNSSAAMYYKGFLESAWEMPFGADLIIQEVTNVLQNEPEETRALLKDYSYGDDEILDDVLDEAAIKLLCAVKKELLRSLSYLKHPPSQVVLTGGGAGIAVKNTAKSVLGARRARIAAHDGLIADNEDMLLPAYTSALSVALYSQQHGGNTGTLVKAKDEGFFNRMLAKLGLN